MYPALVALLLGSFAIGTTEFVVAGLLPAIADDLGVPIPDAGFLVTGYALSVAVGGPLLVLVAARFQRKPALLAVVALFVAGHAISALASGFAVLMLGRAVAAAAHGCFFGIAILLGASIAPPGRQGMALAIVVGGINVANIVGVPLGTAVGTAWGWRAAFVLVGLIGVAAFVAIALFVPNASRAPHTPSRFHDQLRALRDRRVLTSYALIVLHMIAFWSLSTFIAPYFIETGGIGEDFLPLVLFAFGLFGGVGIVAGGRYADRYPVKSLTVSYPIIAACFARHLARDALVVADRRRRHRPRLDGRQPRRDRRAEPHPGRRGGGARARLLADLGGLQPRHRRRRRPRLPGAGGRTAGRRAAAPLRGLHRRRQPARAGRDPRRSAGAALPQKSASCSGPLARHAEEVGTQRRQLLVEAEAGPRGARSGGR